MLIMNVIRARRRRDFVVIEELFGSPRILCQYQIYTFQHLKCAKRDVFEIADWCGNDIKHMKCKFGELSAGSKRGQTQEFDLQSFTTKSD